MIAPSSPLARLEFYRGRIQAHNGALNAFIHLRWDQAREEALASQQRWEQGVSLSPIDGWCVGVKANIAVQGLPHHAGIGAYRDRIASEDAPVVARLKAAGAVIVGVLNMHEGALGATTDNPFFGRTHNPWRAGYTPGGSSGGSAAAVAAGLCDAALGSDTMGSVRIPSAYCGCFGLKPSAGLWPEGGVLALSTTLDHVGVHASSVEALGAMAAAITRQDMAAERRELGSWRFGVWDGGGAVALEPAVAEGFAGLLERLEAAGAALSPAAPQGYEYGRTRRAGLLLSEAEAAAIHADMLGSNPQGFSEEFRKMLAWGAARPESEVREAHALKAAITQAADTLFQTADFVLAPTAPQTAFSFEQPAPANQADFTAWANFAGLPAVAAPMGLSAEGLPLGYQIIGPRGADAATLSAAASLADILEPLPTPPGFT